VLWPPVEDQKQIAALLGDLDERIESLRQTNETLEAMARAIFKSWFVDFDPVRAQAEGREPEGIDAATAALFPSKFQDSELGPIPSGWDFCRLSQVADVNWGDTKTTKSKYVSEGYRAFSASGPDGFMETFMFDHPGVVISAIGANCGATWLARGKWSCIKNTLRFWSTDSEVSTEYLFHQTNNQAFWPKRGSAQPFISQGDARSVKILRPDNRLAALFGDLVRPLHERVSMNIDHTSALSALRDTLLPRLISGKLRVPETEAMLAEAR
jgi:type I restriction enzyme S subunit